MTKIRFVNIKGADYVCVRYETTINMLSINDMILVNYNIERYTFN
jgi:hypothetical protein